MPPQKAPPASSAHTPAWNLSSRDKVSGGGKTSRVQAPVLAPKGRQASTLGSPNFFALRAAPAAPWVKLDPAARGGSGTEGLGPVIPGGTTSNSPAQVSRLYPGPPSASFPQLLQASSLEQGVECINYVATSAATSPRCCVPLSLQPPPLSRSACQSTGAGLSEWPGPRAKETRLARAHPLGASSALLLLPAPPLFGPAPLGPARTRS